MEGPLSNTVTSVSLSTPDVGWFSDLPGDHPLTSHAQL